jgi:hypothetical protein
MTLTKAQRQAIKRVWDRDHQGLSYIQFRRSVVQCIDCIMVKWCSMWLGIEKDGYTHS